MEERLTDELEAAVTVAETEQGLRLATTEATEGQDATNTRGGDGESGGHPDEDVAERADALPPSTPTRGRDGEGDCGRPKACVNTRSEALDDGTSESAGSTARTDTVRDAAEVEVGDSDERHADAGERVEEEEVVPGTPVNDGWDGAEAEIELTRDSPSKAPGAVRKEGLRPRKQTTTFTMPTHKQRVSIKYGEPALEYHGTVFHLEGYSKEESVAVVFDDGDTHRFTATDVKMQARQVGGAWLMRPAAGLAKGALVRLPAPLWLKF